VWWTLIPHVWDLGDLKLDLNIYMTYEDSETGFGLLMEILRDSDIQHF
jgi:hypothetical protein